MTGELPPGPGSSGVVQTLRWFFRPIPFIESCRESYGRVFTVRLGPDRNVVVVADPELARQVMTGPTDVYRAGDANGILRPVVGPSSLLVLDGDKHIRHRRILLPSVAASHGASYASTIEQIASQRIGQWRPGDELVLQDEMEQISLEVIMKVAFGAEPEQRLHRFRELIPEMMERCASPFTILPYFRKELGGITPYARLRRVLDELDGLFFDAIDERRALGADGSDALSLLVRARNEDGEELPNEEIRDELLTMVMAGYETTTSALAWSFERLLRSPAALEFLLADLRAGNEAYLEAVCKEALRLRPVVPVVARKLREEVSLADYTIPAGTVLMASVYLMHRDPVLFEDPDEFVPERFLEGEGEGGAWVPFGGGVRRCLGASFAQLEMEVVLSTVLRSVVLEAIGEADEPIARQRFTFAPGRGARARVSHALVEPA